MKAFVAGLVGLVFGAALGAGGLVWFHHHGSAGRHDGHHSGRHMGDHKGHHGEKSEHSCDTGAGAAGPAAAATGEGKPAYLVVLGDVLDREKFMSEYAAKLPPLYEKFGGQYLAAGRNFEVFEGEAHFKSFVISQWPSMDAARAFWNSPEYEALRRARIAGNWGRFDVYALEGLAAPSTSAAPSTDASAPGDARPH